MKYLIVSAITAIMLLTSLFVKAQFPYAESFKNSAASRIKVSGAAKLTAASGIDPAGEGYLRLTDNTASSIGYAYGLDSFPSNYGLTVSFEFFSYKAGAASYNQADGITFFLFDAGVNAFRPGGLGGSLSYAQYYGTPGMAKGYMGISIDEFGNFSNPADGNKNGGPGQKRGSVAIRGPGNGKSATDYVYQTGVVASDPAYNAGFLGFTQRYADSLNSNYRKIKIILTPGSSLGAKVGYKITVIMYKGGSTLTPVTLINNFDYPFAAPEKLKFGYAASTGALTDYHEIRNMSINATNTDALLAPTTVDDNGVIACQGQQAMIDVTANDHSNNSGGTINRSTLDLDTVTAGQQTTFTDEGKGTYTADTNGIVTFTPVSGYSGVSTISYKVTDSYGITSTVGSTITVTVNAQTGPSLTVINPAALCSPSKIDITNSKFKTDTTAGASYSYFSSLSDANNNANNIDATAADISMSGTYYIRALEGQCPTIKPIAVQINQVPSSSNAGGDQSFCSSAGSQSITLLGSNPDVGAGTWTQVSGPAAAAIAYPDAATSPVSNLNKGVYVFRWTIANGACAVSTDDVQISVGITANAGSKQTLTNATTATLHGNTALPATGLWSQVSGPSVTITNPSDSASTVTELTPGNNYIFSWKITNGACVTTSNVTINDSASALPITLVSFTGKAENHYAALQWQTAAEENNGYFELQRSTDGIQYSTIGKIAGAATSASVHNYSYQDALSSITNTVLYYRLVQVDRDGKLSYSNVVMISLNLEKKFSTWPNPFSSNIYANAYFNKAGIAQIKLFDNTGKLVRQVSQKVVSGYNNITIDHLEKTAIGLFILEISDNETSYIQKVLKK